MSRTLVLTRRFLLRPLSNSSLSRIAHQPTRIAASPAIWTKRSFSTDKQWKYHAGYSVWSDTGVLKVSPSPASFEEYKNRTYILKRPGGVFLEIAPAEKNKGETGRKYDFKKKQMFALSIAELVKIAKFDGKSPLVFTHDKIPNSDVVRKEFKLQQNVEKDHGQTSYTALLSVTTSDKTKRTLQAKLSEDDLDTIKALFEFAIPRAAGWAEGFAASTASESTEQVERLTDEQKKKRQEEIIAE